MFLLKHEFSCDNFLKGLFGAVPFNQASIIVPSRLVFHQHFIIVKHSVIK